ncbi:hypothetical protein [Peijinzhouia sedimentorum]|tara:strand:+ start:128 stop:1348 length:1221 start_codon:yes stop_codon:yes gene_type:complete
MSPVDFIFIPLLFLLGFAVNRQIKARYPYASIKTLDLLFAFHMAMAIVYYIYANFNSSDSKYYHYKVVNNFRGENWFDYFEQGTAFIEFVGWPFIKVFGVGYEGVMMFFALLGYGGMAFFYLLFVENIRFKHSVFGQLLFPLILFLPNMHFWSGSFGKGAIIFLGIGAFFFSLSRISSRWIFAVLGLALVYFVRPHIAFIFVAAAGLALMMGSKGIKPAQKAVAFLALTVVFALIYDKVFAYVGIEEDNFESVDAFAGKYIFELSKAGSSVDISNYNLIQKMTTFIYRPLFFDANGALGLFVSFENLLYVILTFQIFRGGFFTFIWKSDLLTKTSLIAFLASSAALSQITANLGIAIRMKAMIMFLLLFVVLKYMDYKKHKVRQIRWRRYLKQIRMKKQELSMSKI